MSIYGEKGKNFDNLQPITSRQFTTRATNMTMGGISENNYSSNDKDDASRSRGVSALLDEETIRSNMIGSLKDRGVDSRLLDPK